MNSDKKTLYILFGLSLCALLLGCFVQKGEYGNIVIAFIFSVAAVIFGFFVKKRSILLVEHKQVTVLMFAAALMMIAVFYITGLGFGFYKTPVRAVYLIKYIIPYSIAIIAGEYIRRVLLAQENKTVTAISYGAFVLADVLLFMSDNELVTFDRFMDFCGMTVIPAVVANVLYHGLSAKYGCMPNILYKILISIYPYLLPIKPKMPEAMHAFAKLILPIIILIFIRALYERKKITVSRQHKVAKTFIAAFSVLIMTAFVMLISCQFRFGMLVIATESMTGALNKGDAIIYEQYDDQQISKGQIIVFNSDKRKTVHRVIDIEKINGELRYYTKGDANDAADQGYITTDAIIGVQKLKIKHLGYPTVWMRELFK